MRHENKATVHLFVPDNAQRSIYNNQSNGFYGFSDYHQGFQL